MSGIILLNKPRSLSSNTAVNIVKRVVGAKKAGHLGTLDVEAQGLLPIALDSATKLFDTYLNKDKEYLTTFKFGEEHASYDLEGEITNTDNKIITKEEVLKALPNFIGRFAQMPPAYSAKKINGKKAYELAREGKEPELKPKDIEIYDFSLVEQLGENLFRFKVACSSGTYIRALCRDLAAKLSTYAVCYDITRTRCGNFSLDKAFSLEDVKAGKYEIISPDSLFDYEKIKVSSEEEARLLNGQIFSYNLKDGKYRLYYKTFLGIGEVKDGKIKLEMRLN